MADIETSTIPLLCNNSVFFLNKRIYFFDIILKRMHTRAHFLFMFSRLFSVSSIWHQLLLFIICLFNLNYVVTASGFFFKLVSWVQERRRVRIKVKSENGLFHNWPPNSLHTATIYNSSSRELNKHKLRNITFYQDFTFKQLKIPEHLRRCPSETTLTIHIYCKGDQIGCYFHTRKY